LIVVLVRPGGVAARRSARDETKMVEIFFFSLRDDV
jgi:hypothetical protein